MSLSNTYVSTPGTLFNIPVDGNQYVYLLSSINQLAGEIIIRNAGTSPFIVSTTQGLTFSPSLSTQTLSSFTATTPYSFISVVPRTPTEYMLLEAPGFPTRTSRLDLAPNYLYLSTLSTLQLTATPTAQANLGAFYFQNALQAPTATLQLSSIQATRVSTATLEAAILQTNALRTSSLQTNTISYSALPSYITALSTQTLSAATATTTTFAKDITVQGNASFTSNLTVQGTTFFGSTLTIQNITATGPTQGFGSTIYTPSTNITGLVSSLTSYIALSTHTTTNYAATNFISTNSYSAGQSYAQSVQLGPYINPTYQLYVNADHRITGDYTTAALSTLTVSTQSASISSLRYRNAAGQQVEVNAIGNFIYVNGQRIIPERVIGQDMHSIRTSNWISTPVFITSNILLNSSVQVRYSPSSYQYSLELLGSAFFSTNFIADNLAIYGGRDPNAFQAPAFNTIYSSTNGLLLNNRFFIDSSKNFVGINTTNPQYMLDISATLYHANPTAFNTATTWVAISDEAAKENICRIHKEQYLEAFRNIKLKQYTFEPAFAAANRLPTTPQLGFIAQDVELYYPNSVMEKPFYTYADFHFLTTDQIIKTHQAITRMMLSTVTGHSTIIGNQWAYISTTTNLQERITTALGI